MIIVEIIIDWEVENIRKRSIIVIELHFKKFRLFSIDDNDENKNEENNDDEEN